MLEKYRFDEKFDLTIRGGLFRSTAHQYGRDHTFYIKGINVFTK